VRAARIKAVCQLAQSLGGTGASARLIEKAGIEQSWLDDETQPVATECWHRALTALSEEFGSDSLEGLANEVTTPDCLGIWAPVLRGADSVRDALRALKQLGDPDSRVETWETVHSDAHHWQGRLRFEHNEELECDGLLQRAREVELRALVRWLGGRGVHVQSGTPGEAPTVRLSWRRTPIRAWVAGAVVCGAAAVGITTSALVTADPLASVGAAFGASGVGALTMRAITRRRALRRIERCRVATLERALHLQEQKDRAGFRCGTGAVLGGRYQLGEKLDHGAFSNVYAARRLSDGRPVAIKMLHRAVAHDPIAADRLRREASALRLSWQPNVVDLLEEGVSPDGCVFLALERLEGETLADRLNRQGTLSPRELLPIALQVCEALSAAHAAGVIHRDVKPHNIFLTDSLSEHWVKLLDFGIAHVEWEETHLTDDGGRLGTPGYIAPEQDFGERCNSQSDIYSLGVVLEQCLSGESPADRWSNPERGSGEFLRGADLPGEWRAVIARATHADRELRYATVGELAQDLRRLASSDESARPAERASQS
jgi:hypothetical protein